MNTKTGQINMWDKIMMAITFAEAGEPEAARNMLKKRPGKEQRPDSRIRKEAGNRQQLHV